MNVASFWDWQRKLAASVAEAQRRLESQRGQGVMEAQWLDQPLLLHQLREQRRLQLLRAYYAGASCFPPGFPARTSARAAPQAGQRGLPADPPVGPGNLVHPTTSGGGVAAARPVDDLPPAAVDSTSARAEKPPAAAQTDRSAATGIGTKRNHRTGRGFRLGTIDSLLEAARAGSGTIEMDFGPLKLKRVLPTCREVAAPRKEASPASPASSRSFDEKLDEAAADHLTSDFPSPPSPSSPRKRKKKMRLPTCSDIAPPVVRHAPPQLAWTASDAENMLNSSHQTQAAASGHQGDQQEQEQDEQERSTELPPHGTSALSRASLQDHIIPALEIIGGSQQDNGGAGWGVQILPTLCPDPPLALTMTPAPSARAVGALLGKEARGRLKVALATSLAQRVPPEEEVGQSGLEQAARPAKRARLQRVDTNAGRRGDIGGRVPTSSPASAVVEAAAAAAVEAAKAGMHAPRERLPSPRSLSSELRDNIVA